MLLIHWSKHKNTTDILKNGIRPKKRKARDEYLESIKGVWSFPFTRNKTLNTNWKRNLKAWRQDLSNYNGFVFKLEESDFPIYAGDFRGIGYCPDKSIYNTMEEFKKVYGPCFSPKELRMEWDDKYLEEGWLDYQDFEIILPYRIEPKRIKKVLKDRNSKGNKPK